MEKNSRPLLFAGLLLTASLIVSLALIFARSDSETEESEESTVSENGEAAEGQQPNPNPRPDPVPQPPPGPQPTGLPSDWSSLTTREKNDLNPYGCDRETQWVSAEDGSCIIGKATEDGPDSAHSSDSLRFGPIASIREHCLEQPDDCLTFELRDPPDPTAFDKYPDELERQRYNCRGEEVIIEVSEMIGPVSPGPAILCGSQQAYERYLALKADLLDADVEGEDAWAKNRASMMVPQADVIYYFLK